MQKSILKYLPKELFYELDGMDFCDAEELRLRAMGASTIYVNGEEKLLNYVATREDIDSIVLALSEHSVFAFMDELKQGYFSIEGGIRIGVAGRTICDCGKIVHIRDFSSINIRFPRQIRGIAKVIFPFITKRGSLLSTLIISPPQMGKTTLLRDIVRTASDDGKKCSVIDERCEISAEGRFDTGIRTDVLTACPKAAGMNLALRSLSPDIIATDEIGNKEDLSAIYDAANAGVKVIATAHGADIDELTNRLFFKQLMEMKTIERVVVLSDSLGRGTVESIYNQELEKVCNVPFLLRGETV